MKDRNTIDSLKTDIAFLEEIASYLEYGDTENALQLIDDWQEELSRALIDLEEEMELFEKDATAYYRQGIEKTIADVIRQPDCSFPIVQDDTE